MNKKNLRLKFILFDMLAATIVWLLFMVFRRVTNDNQIFQGVPIFIPNYDYYSTFIIFPIFCVLIHYLTGYYVNPIKESRFQELTVTFISSVIISIIVFFVILLDDVVVDYSYYYNSLLVLFGMLFFITLIFRVLQSANIRRYFKNKKWTINTLIVGTGSNAKRIAGDIKKKSYFNTVVGFIQVEKQERDVADDFVVGSIVDLEKIINELNIKEAIVALDDPSEQKIFDIISKLFRYDIDIQFTPRLYEILTGRVQINKYGINPLVTVSRSTMTDWQFCVKRTLDIILSAISLVILSPLIIYFFIAIKIDSKGAVIFKQERIGYHGKPFNILKFRTMQTNAENGTPKLSTPNDERVTNVGRNLRKYRFDEIPQFVNVLKGDMSLVGPRPERQYYIDQITQHAPYYCLLYRIKPGLTSWGPIKIGYSDTIEKMIERLNFDIVYMENMNLKTDMKIILSTLEIIFRGKGV